MMAERELRALETVLDRETRTNVNGWKDLSTVLISCILGHSLPQTSTSKSGNEETGKSGIVSQHFHDEERQKLIGRLDNL
jgi:hypothetical protein